MKNIKNILALFLVVAMLLALGACGKVAETTKDTDASSEEEYDDLFWEDEDDEYFDDIQDTLQSGTDAASTTQSVSTQIPTTPTTPTQQTVSTTQDSQSGQSGQTVKPTQSVNVDNQIPETTQPQQLTGVKSVVFENNGAPQIVYYPSELTVSKKKYPVIAWANGTGCSPKMYKGLLENLAAGGYVVVANEETMAADGTAQLDSVDFILNESKQSSSVFYKKINTDKIGLAGHSQGGRSAVNAAAADSRIDCVLSLAGSNYVEEAEKLSTPVFFVAGTNDIIVSPKKWIVTAYNACKGPAVYASLDGAVHTTCCTDPSSYSGYAIKWFDAWLKNDAKAKSTFTLGGALSKDSQWVDFACKGL